MILEAYRECLQDVFDLPALSELMAAIERREVRIVEVETPMPSPFATSLQFGFVASFIYEGDVPLAERRAQALSLDRSLLAEIMGREELRELIDDAALTQLELELQLLDRRTQGTRCRRSARCAALARGPEPPRDQGAFPTSRRGESWLSELQSSRRALALRVAGDERFIAIEDAAALSRRSRYRAANRGPRGVPRTRRGCAR